MLTTRSNTAPRAIDSFGADGDGITFGEHLDEPSSRPIGLRATPEVGQWNFDYRLDVSFGSFVSVCEFARGTDRCRLSRLYTTRATLTPRRLRQYCCSPPTPPPPLRPRPAPRLLFRSRALSLQSQHFTTSRELRKKNITTQGSSSGGRSTKIHV